MSKFVKFTRLDNTPVYLNAAFVVTVEPRRGGGSVVVPIGDGLDYDVKESSERVLEILADAPTPAVVPVSSPTGLTHTPDDVSPDPDIDLAYAPLSVEEQRERAPKPEPLAPLAPPAPACKPKAEPKAEPMAEIDPPLAPVIEVSPTPEKPSRGRRKTAAAPRKPRATRKSKTAKPTLTDDQLSRLRKMAPGSMRKLQNTLITQFKVADADAETAALVAVGVIALDRDHVAWQAPVE